MDVNSRIYYSIMADDKKHKTAALAAFHTRWELLTDIHHNLQERFIGKLLEKINGKDTLIITPHLDKIEALQKHISDHIDTVEPKILHQYAFNLKEVAILAIKMCKKYKVYDDIKSYRYNTETKMIELNDEDLYFLGEMKKQFEPSASSPAKKNPTCTTCESNNLSKLSELHHNQLSNPTYAPPRKKFAFFGLFLTCFFIGKGLYAMSGSVEPPYLDLFVGFACFVYTTYAFHYNFKTFPTVGNQWDKSYSCNDCGSISIEKCK